MTEPIPFVGHVELDKKPKIFIATPMYGGQCHGVYAQSILTLPNTLSANGIDCVFSFMFNESLIQRARNALSNGFLKTDCTHLMFIDSDIRFKPQDIVHMVRADKDVICGIYPKKEINWETVKQAMDAGVPNNDLKLHTGSFVVNLKNYDATVTVPMNEPVEIWNGGTGFMLIKREVLEKLSEKVNYYINDVLDLAGTMGRDKIFEFFPVFIEEESRRLLSEDYAFCKIARDNGIKIYAAPWVELAHAGSYLFEGQLLKS